MLKLTAEEPLVKGFSSAGLGARKNGGEDALNHDDDWFEEEDEDSEDDDDDHSDSDGDGGSGASVSTSKRRLWQQMSLGGLSLAILAQRGMKHAVTQSRSKLLLTAKVAPARSVSRRRSKEKAVTETWTPVFIDGFLRPVLTVRCVACCGCMWVCLLGLRFGLPFALGWVASRWVGRRYLVCMWVSAI